MANQLLKDLKSGIRNATPVNRVIIINASVFVLISLIEIADWISNHSMVVGTIEYVLTTNLTLPLGFMRFLVKPWTILTYMFVQEDLFHILWNMVTFYWFGKLLCYYTATKKIIPLYILGGIAGGLVAMLSVAVIPMFHGYAAVQRLTGASAAVTAIIVASATLVPDVKMNVLLIGPVKLLYIAVFVIFIDVLNLASNGEVAGNISHLGGALMGYFFIVQYKQGRDMSKWINRFFDWVRGLFKINPRSTMKVAHRRAIPDEEYNMTRKAHQQTVDEILDKISKSGYDSLTKAEKEILFKASNKI